MDCVVTKAERNGERPRSRSLTTQEAAILQIAGTTKDRCTAARICRYNLPNRYVFARLAPAICKIAAMGWYQRLTTND